MSLIIRDGAVLVRAPYFVDDKQINNFVLSKQDWIQKKLAEHRPMGFLWGQTSLRVFGFDYKVRYFEAAKFQVVLDRDLCIYKPATMRESRCVELVELHFKNQLDSILQERVAYYAQCLHLKTPDFTVRRYKRLYGRCTKDHRLSFNTYLFHDSRDFIDYVVLHECAHILEFNHSSRFYDIVASIMPDYKAIIEANKSSSTPHPGQ